MGEGEEQYGAVVCAPPGASQPGTTNMLVISTTARVMECFPGWAYYGLAVTAHAKTPDGDTYVAAGYTYTSTDKYAQVIALHPIAEAVYDTPYTVPLFAYIPRDDDNMLNREYEYVGVYVVDVNPYDINSINEKEYLAKFNSTQYVLKTTLDDGTTVVTPYYELAHPVIPLVEEGPHIVLQTINKDTNTGDAYFIGFDIDTLDAAIYRVSGSDLSVQQIVKIPPFEFNAVFSSILEKIFPFGGEWAMCVDDGEYTILQPAREGEDRYYYLIKYYQGSDGLRVVKKIHLPDDNYRREVPVRLLCSDSSNVVYIIPSKGTLYGLKRYDITGMWVGVDPPYFREPPGSSVQAYISSNIDATLVDINAPEYITVNAPQNVSTAKQPITFEISPEAPEEEYGLIALTYRADDGTEFKSGIVYLTEQLNDPPTTPLITGVDIEYGLATIYWEESYDPDGDPITYIVKVYDDTDLVTIYEENVQTSQVSVPVTVNHAYTVYVTATDGNLMSDTATYQFTYPLTMSVTLLDPVVEVRPK
ncbi:TPA: hypothetical protein EYP13_02830, partial [Candidatus Micrarchaeota archaeon]|nr:hypothetical protein [Candidatus Micrarchaeota archaeon]